jgi:tetratricopeptide (TPR) repeat protein
VRNLVGASDQSLGIEQIVESRAEGNPLIVEEVIRALIDLGGLEPDDQGAWRATARAAEISLPSTIESLIMARVDRLGDSPKQTLKLASVIGRIFFYRVLAAVSRRIQQLDDDLAELQSVELIRERRLEPEKELAFQHALVQEATYESVLLRQRRQLHREVAEAVESLYPDRIEEFHSRLAYHYTRAEEWDKAREHLVKAGDQALSIAANAEAITHLERALEAQSALSRSRPDLASEIDPLERATLWRKVATLRVKQRRMADALVAIEEAEAELERCRQETADWWVEWIELELEKTLALYFSRAGAALFALLETLGPIVDGWGTPVQKGQFLLRVASASFVRERFRPSRQTLDHARAACELGVGSVREERVVFYGLCLLWADRLDEAGEVLANALSLAEQADDLMQRATALTYMACVERRRGDVARTKEFSDRCLAVAREGAVPLYQGVALANLAWAHGGEGDLPAAERDARDALVYLTNPAIVYAWTWLARWPLIGVLLRRGDTGEAAEQAAAMLEPTQQELPTELAQALSNSTDLWEQGQEDGARAGLLAAHRLADSLGYA